MEEILHAVICNERLFQPSVNLRSDGAAHKIFSAAKTLKANRLFFIRNGEKCHFRGCLTPMGSDMPMNLYKISLKTRIN